MNINFKKLTETAITPVKSHKTDAGFDLFADEDIQILNNGRAAKVKTGIAVELPEGYFADVRPRSGLTSKTSLRVQCGTVDSGYIGEISVIADNVAAVNWGIGQTLMKSAARGVPDITVRPNMDAYPIKRGDKIAQLVIQKLPEIELVEVNELSDSERGINGFGSTGTK